MSYSLCQMVRELQSGSNMIGTDVARFTHNQSRSYLNHLVRRNEIGNIVTLRRVCATIAAAEKQ